ncbi:succinylglutamate desuccinylase/aspartoacylase family protein [Haladaptatus pallidirubidus]|uniref:Succinylglutamate desuccinylase/aspartoacylase family protein n=1 Tax=Haladaptatus pallidirubidus TaxID=1008152 RepID=A0AAV3UJM5_9EURY|nr:succinylglutamate desuccinylase/aspartoacylase family protein [Haladaptatus pallidirubidus]
MDESTHTATNETLARLPSGTQIKTTIHTYTGSENGPTVYIQAAQHGREVNGAEVLRRLHDQIIDVDLAGRVIAVPVADPITFDHVSYITPEQLDPVNPNMNRVWPGKENGSVHERMAARLWKHARQADVIIDLHTGSPNMLPHVVALDGHADSIELGRVFGTGLLLTEQAHTAASEEWHRRSFGGKLRVAAVEEGIPSITPELAYSKQIIEDAVEIGLTGILNVLRHLDILDEPPVDTGPQTLARNHLGRIVASESGLFRSTPDITVGSSVENGTFLGTLYDPTTYEPLQTVRADRNGLLYVLTQEATIIMGETLANIAEPYDSQD